MRTELDSRIKRLLSNLSDNGSRHLAEIESDLAQTNYLIGGAVEKLGASFLAIHAAITAQQDAVDQLLALAAPTPQLAAQLAGSRAEIERHVNAAVTGLQFQDMTSQLVECTIKRVAALRDALGGAVQPAETEAAEIVAMLGHINQALEEQSAKLEGRPGKAVSQTHMESGDVELF